MKKIIYPVVLSLSALLASPSFAYISGKVALNEKRIYCPEQIICTDSKIDSCTYNSDDAKYWDLRAPAAAKGTYKFWKVCSGFHDGSQTSCMYKYQQNPSGMSLLFSKNEANLEAYYDKITNWTLRESHFFECQSDSICSCPLKEISGLKVSFTNTNSPNANLKFSADDVPVGNVCWSCGYGGYVTIRYENAPSCWSAKQCKIDIEMFSDDLGHVPLGSVIVDMDNKMKIVEIISNQGSKMDIKKIEPFNTIEIKRSDTPPYPTLEIDTFTRSEVSVLINDVDVTKIAKIDYMNDIRKAKHGDLFSYRAKEVCPNSRECKIDLKATMGGLIGSVVIDVENSMNIVSVQSTRPSEIAINKVNYHKIEINYPNFLNK